MKVIFVNRYEEEKILGEDLKTREECFKIIKDFLDKNNYKSYYYRTYHTGEYEVVDVGSWSEFFHIYK